MRYKDEPHPIDRYAHSRITRKARQLVGRWGFTESDVPDLEQYFATCLSRALVTFDPEVAHWHVFVITLIERSADKLRRRQCRQKRWMGQPPVSLSEQVEDGDGLPVDLGDVLPDDAAFQRTRVSVPAQIEHVDRACDVEALLRRLAPEQAELCRQLMTMTVTEVAQQRGVPRSTLVDEIAQLQSVFAAAGLGEIRSRKNRDRTQRRGRVVVDTKGKTQFPKAHQEQPV